MKTIGLTIIIGVALVMLVLFIKNKREEKTKPPITSEPIIECGPLEAIAVEVLDTVDCEPLEGIAEKLN
jgi:hypothetical protein